MLSGTILVPALYTAYKLKEDKNDAILRSVFIFSGGFEYHLIILYWTVPNILVIWRPYITLTTLHALR